MSAQLSIDPAHSALLCMDCQTGIVSIYTKDQDMLPRAASVLKQARSAALPVIYVQVGFRHKFSRDQPAQRRLQRHQNFAPIPATLCRPRQRNSFFGRS